MPQANILAPGYSKGHVEDCLQERFGSAKTLLQGIFVNSTISLEGVVRWLSQVGLTGSEQPPMGCFDWDPFVYLLGARYRHGAAGRAGDAGRGFFDY